MKKFTCVATGLFFFLVVGCITAKAQKETKVFSAGFGLEAGRPIGGASNPYDFTGGLTIRFAYHAGPGFITLTTGARAWLPKTGAGNATKASIQIPIKAGYKYVIYKPFFVMGEMGYSLFKIYYAGEGGKVASNSTGGFTFAPTVGVNFNALELGIKYEATSLTGGMVSNIGVRLGFNF